MVLADNIFGSPEEDALRRDFTINALAYNIADSSVVDFSTGLTDLKERLIRCYRRPLREIHGGPCPDAPRGPLRGIA